MIPQFIPKSGNNSPNEVHTPKILNTINSSAIPNHKLRLKIGVPIMLLRNIDLNLGLCNTVGNHKDEKICP